MSDHLPEQAPGDEKTSNQIVSEAPSNPEPATNPYAVMHGQDPRFINVEMIGNFIFTAIVLPGTLIGLIILYLFMGFGIVFYSLLVAWIVLAILLSWTTFVWPKMEFKYYRWQLDQQCLEIHSGVWWKHRIAVPLGRVQHADVAQGPLLRRFELGELVIHTAGTGESKIAIKGLTHETAIALRDRLIAQAQTRAVT